MRKLHGVIILSIVFCFILSGGSCSSRESENITPEKNLRAVLTVRISGVNETNISKLAAVSNNSNGVSGKNDRALNKLGKEELISTGKFDALIDIREDLNRFLPGNKSATLPEKASLNILASSVPLQNDKQYRILIYDEIGTTLIQNVVATSGINPNIGVDGGKRYKWVAFSLNTAAVPDVNSGKISAEKIANADLLYASGIIDATAGQNYLDIIFEHKTTRIDVNIDTRGLFGNINTFNTLQIGTGTQNQFNSLIRSADLNVLTGSFESFKAVDDSKTAIYMSNTDLATGDMVKKITIYTIIPSGTVIREQNLMIQPVFYINLDKPVMYPPSAEDVTIRKYGNNNTYLQVNNIAFTPEEGKHYIFNIRMIESAIRVGGISWARSDLWYDGNTTLDQYKFRPDTGIEPYNTGSQTEYWTWKSITPTGTPGSGDPCTLVYPLGIWRMPTSDELTIINNRTSAEYKGLSEGDGNPNAQADTYDWYAVINQKWNIDSGSSRNAGDYSGYSDKLILTFNGYYQNENLLNPRIVIDSRKKNSFTANVIMRYWSGTDNGGSGIALNQSATVRYKQPYDYDTTYNNRGMGAYSQSLRFNIRCVRS
ncbi:hypothetical protein CMT19_16715 [Elizabethkingia anophelis]|nr:hypothetical protein [Elizabethkingia anophelis]